MKTEQPYDFRKKLLTVHEPNVRDYAVTPAEGQMALKDGAVISVCGSGYSLLSVAAEDFADFLRVSMGITARVCHEPVVGGENTVTLCLAKDAGVALEEAEGYKGFRIDVSDGIRVYGYDDRGVAAALYYIEDLMSMAHGPVLEKGTIKKKPLMAPLMVHSGYGMEEWPDEYLMRIAHEGRDALLVFVTGPNQTRVGELDFNDLIARAGKFGLDVYAYSFMQSGMHPDEDGAEAFYDSIYGELFRKFPGFKGVTMVGEVVEFNSKDPHVSKFRSWDVYTDDLPDGKFWPGWYPCEDLPKWVELVKKVIRNVKPDADIVLWSYNWGFQPEEDRVRLIENLPTDITLESTFEMFDHKKLGDVYTACDDYSLAFAGPGPYFTSEAIAAKKRGIKLYTMSQAAGITWDFGCVSYLPMPYQWAKRFENMRKAIHDWGLCGSMDTHHHGFYPSIISKFSKLAFLTPEEPLEEILDRLFVAEYGAENIAAVREGFRLWSEAITYFTPTNGDQGGASRVGPAYPFCLYHQAKIPYKKEAMFGGRIVSTRHGDDTVHPSFISKEPNASAMPLRIGRELESLRTMHSLMEKGVAVFEAIPEKNEKLLRLINLGKYITNCVLTNIHAKEWHILKCRLNAAFDRDSMLMIVAEMEKLLHGEIQNAEATIPLVEADSRLGWEPSMLYLGDKAHLEWKIRQVHYVLEKELAYLKKSIQL